MRKVAFFSSILFFGLMANVAFAQNPGLIPFGGTIFLAPLPGSICPGTVVFEPTSPFAIIPYGTGGIPGPFSELPGPQAYGQVVTGAYVLGLYLPVPIPDCTVAVPPGGPVPVLKAVLFGTSVPFDFPI